MVSGLGPAWCCGLTELGAWIGGRACSARLKGVSRLTRESSISVGHLWRLLLVVLEEADVQCMCSHLDRHVKSHDASRVFKCPAVSGDYHCPD